MSNSKLYIDFTKVKKNIKYISKNKEVCLMVKGNCYGMGIESIGQLIELGYDYFGVSTIEEAKEVRKFSDNVNVLIVVPVEDEHFEEAISNNFEITITDIEQLKKVDKRIKFHLKFDTGMGRIGFKNEEIKKVQEIIIENKISPFGLFSHLAKASDDNYTNVQVDFFKEIIKQFKRFEINKIHIQNTVGSIRFDIPETNMVRIGIGMWGYLGNKHESELFGKELQESLTLSSRVIHTKDYQGKIGYDATEIVHGRIATIGIGYHDFLPLSAQGLTFSTGEKIVGKVCMCQSMLEINDDIKEIQIFGDQNSIYEIAEFTNLSVYSLLSNLSNRVKKNYRR